MTDGTIYADSGVGILMRAGIANITGGTIISTGTTAGKVGDSEVLVSCNGVVYDEKANYPGGDETGCVKISGTVTVRANGTDVDAVTVIAPEGGNTTTRMEISGGKFSSDVSDYCALGLASSDGDNDGTFEIVTDTSMFQSGNGTQANPFMIMTEGQLKNFAASVNGGATYEGQYIQLGNDIPLTENWSPMGTFSGTFDGQNHSVTGLNIINEPAIPDSSAICPAQQSGS